MRKTLLILTLAVAAVGSISAQVCDTIRHGNQTIIVKNNSNDGISVDITEIQTINGKNVKKQVYRGHYSNKKDIEQRYINSNINRIIFGRNKKTPCKSYFDVGIGGFGFGPVTLTGDAGDHLKNAASLRYTLGLMNAQYHYGKWAFSIGLNIEFNSIHLDGNYAFKENEDTNSAYLIKAPEGHEYDKSRLHITYMNIPLLVKFYPTKDFDISFGPQLKIRTASSSKVWDKVYKGHTKLGNNLGLNTILPSLLLKMSYNAFGAFVTYDLLPAFKDNHGPKGNMISVGVSVGF